ncbi:Receptor-like serine/threonine-protein kinase SD1-8 [Triticum urartu]|uniref:Receptor-like serine/threonine-protein kinase n=2 Tax=Triticum urartu TaxID=4572 RepID=M7YWV4_TRIUA|nr:Receptor-like serine/threonine-protein kinase SD1-8 [Triticum urartu]
MFLKLRVMLVSVLLLCYGTCSAAGVSSRDDTLNDGRRNITDGQTLVSAGGLVPPRLLLRDVSGETALSSLNTTTGGGGATSSSSSAEARLLESGNLVVVRDDDEEEGSGAVLWQSFDHPSNTLIAGMRLGRNPQTGAEWSGRSWRSPDDPATGDCRRAMDTRGLPDCVSWRGDVKKYRTGPWNGLWFSGVPEMASYSDMFTNQVVVRPDEVAYVFNATAAAPFSRLVLSEAGVIQRLAWDGGSRVWNVFAQAPRDVCDDYAKCGAFGLCNVNTAATLFCGGVQGDVPGSPAHWSMREAAAGCRRNVPLQCRDGGATTDGFVVVSGVKLPDTDNATVDVGATLEGCRARCLANCSCVAFAAADIRGGGGGSGCVIWVGDIVDVRYVDKGQDLYVRLAKSELAAANKKRWGNRRNKDVQAKSILGGASNQLIGDENIELPLVSFRDIVTATNDFSNENMLGQGGFGKVYKGILEDEKEVAIKRLSKSSGQGAEEFRNEVVLIAKLQHRNLVRLLGYCIHEDERLLIYEYLPNKSLDVFIFDAASKYVLDWPTRFQIIKGVARGLLYLHQDSRLTIIHRDLKSSNILLDEDMSPKISDFGMARIFGRDQQEANTNRVVGTYGYMSPEYAMDGAFSVKSDTYSFGVLLLEIISGLKISLPHLSEFPNLLAYAWNLWNDGKPMDMVDSSTADNCSPTEVLRCIHIGLLCVQDNPYNRPLMSSVVFMLENETTELSTPRQPVYFAYRNSEAKETGENTSSSMNNMSVTMFEGR